MAVAPPPVDPRDFATLVRTRRRRPRGARAAAARGRGTARSGRRLVHIFARLAEIVVDRINGVPDKNLLAFLALVGVDRQPPQPARAPVTFHLAQGATRARLLAGTTVAAAPATGETAPPVYETELELVLTPRARRRVHARAGARPLPGRDERHHALGAASMTVFEGARPIPHELYVADDAPRAAAAEGRHTLAPAGRRGAFAGQPRSSGRTSTASNGNGVADARSELKA